MREAEVKHARLAMLAAAGWPLSELLDGPLSTRYPTPTPNPTPSPSLTLTLNPSLSLSLSLP